MFKVGDKVKYASPGGSIGEVDAVREYDNAFGWGRTTLYSVRWVYGRDIKGDMMTGYSSNMREHEMKSVTEEEYAIACDREGFSDTRGDQK